MARLTQSQRFDSGIQSSKRLNPESAFAFIKGDVSDDPFAVKPAKAMTKINNETELLIKGIGESSGGSLLGVGSATSNWISKDFTERVHVQDDWDFVGGSYFNLADLGQRFWKNVTQESDIFVISSGHSTEFVDYVIIGFNASTKSGWIVSDRGNNFYIYTSSNYSFPQDANLDLAAKWYFPFEGTSQSYTTDKVTIETEGTFGDGIIGQGLVGTSRISGLQVGGRDELTITWMMKTPSTVAGTTTVFSLSNGVFALGIAGDGRFTFEISGTSNNPNGTVGSSYDIRDGEWHAYTLFMNNNQTLDIYQGTKLLGQYSVGNFGDFDTGGGDTYFYCLQGIEMDELSIDYQDNDYNISYAPTLTNLLNGNARNYSWEDINTDPYTYGALQVYQLGGENAWSGIVGSEIIKDKDATSTDYGMVFQTSSSYTYWFSRQGSSNGIYYMSQYDVTTKNIDGTFDSMQSIPSGSYVSRAQYQQHFLYQTVQL